MLVTDAFSNKQNLPRPVKNSKNISKCLRSHHYGIHYTYDSELNQSAEQ